MATSQTHHPREHSWIMIPGPVPFTLQTAGVFFTLFTLGGVKGTISVLVYILLGIIGLPVFSGFGSGISVILGPTGGYIVGFLATGICVCIGDIVRKKTGFKKIYTQIISMLAGDGDGSFNIEFKNPSVIKSFHGKALIKKNIAVLLFEEFEKSDGEWSYTDGTDLENYKEILFFSFEDENLVVKVKATGKTFVYKRLAA